MDFTPAKTGNNSFCINLTQLNVRSYIVKNISAILKSLAFGVLAMVALCALAEYGISSVLKERTNERITIISSVLKERTNERITIISSVLKERTNERITIISSVLKERTKERVARLTNPTQPNLTKE